MTSFEPAPADAGPEAAAAAEPALEREAAAAAAEPANRSQVATALAELDRLPGLELAEHPDLYQRIHTELQGALSAIDDA